MRNFSYTILKDGTCKEEITEVPDDDTPQKRRVKAMAEAQPGRIAMGWGFVSPENSHEDEAYLDELAGGDETVGVPS